MSTTNPDLLEYVAACYNNKYKVIITAIVSFISNLLTQFDVTMVNAHNSLLGNAMCS